MYFIRLLTAFLLITIFASAAVAGPHGDSMDPQLLTSSEHRQEINVEREISDSSAGKGRENGKEEQNKDETGVVSGWFADTAGGEFKIGLDKDEKHSGSRSAYIKSAVAKPKHEKFGNLCQWISAEEYRGKHLKMSAWIKTALESGTAQLWVRVDGQGHGDAKRDCFDNMDDRPIKGITDWTQYSVVVDVPSTSSYIYFGCMLPHGTGKLWFDDVTLESVSKDIPLTGCFTTANLKTKEGQGKNLNFEDNDSN